MTPARNVESHLRGSAATPSPSDIAGRWRNELGSEMTIAQDAGVLTGTYRTGVGAPSRNVEHPLSGSVAGDLVAFVVDFGAYGALTAWVGHHVEDGAGERISTLWHMTRTLPHPEDADQQWSTIVAGADDFRHVET